MCKISSQKKKKKAFLKEIEEYLNKWKDGLEDSILKKISILPKCIHKYNKNPVKITGGFLIELIKLIPLLTWKCKGYIIIVKTTLKKNKVRGLIIPDSMTSYRTSVSRQCHTVVNIDK